MSPTNRPARLALALVAATALAADPEVLRVTASEDEIPRLRGRLRHTTVIRLPEDERILDWVLGDSEYWAVSGAANVAYLKPSGEGVETNLALVCESGRIYTFVAREGGTPHLAVYVERPPDDSAPAPRGSPVHQPAFVPRDALRDAEDRARLAADRSREAVEGARAALRDGIDEHLETYPRELRFPYELDPRAREWPFMVEAMWHDGRVTYIRSLAPEAPAIYETKDGKAALVGYDLRDGVYVTQHVLGPGWLQLGKARRNWKVRNPEALAAQIEAAAERGPR